MVVLYIIGAGCSRNYDQCDSKVPGLKPPLNSSFFEMARKVVDFYNLADSSSMIGLNGLVWDLDRLYGYTNSEKINTAVFDDQRLTLEGVMTHFYLESELLNRDRMPEDLRGFQTSILNELVAYTIAESLKGPMCNKHLHLAEKMQRGDIIWNFNYDLLMDNALYALGKLTDSGYIMRFDYALVNDNWERFQDAPSEVTVLKLHGSLNWLRCRTCGSILLLRYMKSVPELWTKIQKPRLQCPKCQHLGLERIIVPPSLVKNFELVELRYLWKHASTPRHNIDRIITIGFRFAEEDSELEMLFRTMVRDGQISSDTPILIVNTNPTKVSERFRSIFDKSEITTSDPTIFFNT